MAVTLTKKELAVVSQVFKKAHDVFYTQLESSSGDNILDWGLRFIYATPSAEKEGLYLKLAKSP